MEKPIIEIPNTFFYKTVKEELVKGKSVKILAKGHSMRLFLKSKRDSVIITPINADDIQLYDVVLAEINPHFWVLHRIIRIDHNIITLMGDGNIKGTEQCTRQQIIGKATAFYRKGRNKPDFVDNPKWKIYSCIWLKLQPIRRYILALVRRLPWDI